MKPEPGMFTYARKSYKAGLLIVAILLLCFAVAGVKSVFLSPDFGRAFGQKVTLANHKLQQLDSYFSLCAELCDVEPTFMQSIIFPEVMRYNRLKDGVEAESLRTLYVQFGEEYANFSIGLFQMKPSFATEVESMSKELLPATLRNELLLDYSTADETTIRLQRVERLQDEHWQLVYLTAFIAICNKIYADQPFVSTSEKLQWYATVYNAGFNHSNAYIQQKIEQDNFYLSENMPGKKFKYAAIVLWHYQQQNKQTNASLTLAVSK